MPEKTSESGRSVRQLKPGDHTVVIGGGPAGLTAAYQLAKAGQRVTVLEGDNIVGGISKTATYKGYRFDIGGHRFFTKIKPVQDLWIEILNDDFMSVPRMSRIHYLGKFFDYPLKAKNALQGLGIFNAVAIVLSYIKAQIKPYPVEENFEQWVSNRFGKRLYNIFFKTYTEKVWGIACTEIRAEWAAQRIQNLSLGKAILNAAAMNKRSTKIKSLIDSFEYPKFGPGQMWESCRDRIIEMGSEVRMETRATRLEVENDRVIAVHVDGCNGPERIEADHVISTMPVRSLIRSMSDHATAEAKEGGEGLRYRDFLVVALMIDQEDIFPDNWIYIHTPGVKVGRVQNFNNWSKAMIPDEGKTCLGLEYFCFEGDGLWTMKDEDLVALATKEIGELNLADQDKVFDGCVIRQEKAYPIYDSVYRGHLDATRTYLDTIDNLHPVGRNGMHKYNNQDHSMLTAMMAIWNMQGANHDIWEVNTDYEYHEEQRLEDEENLEPQKS